MKKLMKIGVLLLFMIGLFTVQLDFKPLNENDVGMEYVDNLNSFNDNAILTVIENPGQVASPLKYPLYSYERTLIARENQICLIVSNSYIIDNILYQMAIQDQTILEKQLTNDNLQTGETNQIEGLFRLDIRENS